MARHLSQGDFVMWRGQQMMYLRPRSDRGPGLVQIKFTGRANRNLRDVIVHRDDVSDPVPFTPEADRHEPTTLSRGFVCDLPFCGNYATTEIVDVETERQVGIRCDDHPYPEAREAS